MTQLAEEGPAKRPAHDPQADPLPDLLCQAAPPDGQPDPPTPARQPASPAPPHDPSSPAESARADAAAAVRELEIEIRSYGTEQPQARDLAADALRLVRESLALMGAEVAQRVLAQVRGRLSADYLDPDFWRGLAMVLRYQAEEAASVIRRRVRGQTSTDAFGLDTELVELVRPFSAFLYRTWWRVTAEGLEHVPGAGGALLVANHSGVLPWDSVMIASAVLEQHPAPRVVRTLYDSWLALLPGAAPALAAFGQVPAQPGNVRQLLADGQLVCAFPEGPRGLGKLFRERYQLARFQCGLLRPALQSGAPIVPVAVIGAEEIYPMLGDARPLAQALGFPYFPLTPLFPWLGPLGLVPLPVKWTIVFGAPVDTAAYAPAADNSLLVDRFAAQVRERIQDTISQRLADRTSIF